ncbi:hypothetical protein [Acidocella sp.]|nr:hypothetical protein [Acidocella sp.]NNM57113.1 hypothetical protein [Acidocella sp.]
MGADGGQLLSVAETGNLSQSAEALIEHARRILGDLDCVRDCLRASAA